MTGPNLSPVLRRGAGNKVRWVLQCVAVLINALLFAWAIVILSVFIGLLLNERKYQQTVLAGAVAIGGIVLSVLNLAELRHPFRLARSSDKVVDLSGPPMRLHGSGARSQWWCRSLQMVNAALAAAAVLLVAVVNPSAPAKLASILFVALPFAACAAAYTWPPSYLQPHECQGCEYDLTRVLGDVCPECGRTRAS